MSGYAGVYAYDHKKARANEPDGQKDNALLNARDHLERAADRLEHLGYREESSRLRRAADECRGALITAPVTNGER
jgi:hypothetical protein